MGGRLLRKWLLKPLVNADEIEERYDAVDEFSKRSSFTNKLKEDILTLVDIERLLSRLSAGIGNPRDIANLKSSLESAHQIKKVLSNFKSSLLAGLEKEVDKDALALVTFIDNHIVEEPPIDAKNGNYVKSGVSKELDSLRKTVAGSKDYILELERKERESTGIGSLKVKFNQVFGYYIEVTKPNLHLVPDNYFRKQTTVNAERFITEELKKHEEIILTAEERINDLEFEIFLSIVEKVVDDTEHIQKAALALAAIDCLINFSCLAQSDKYCRPKLVDAGDINIKSGRHPVVESLLPLGEFDPNDALLNQQDHQLILITGPNMAGKSVYMRQVAIVVLLAQIGCFVPADSAAISLVDKIFVRSGASDIISQGLSTFMVEMVETAHILNNATNKSLIVMDEIGRGTSTYDGISIAWSVAEYLVTNPKVSAKTLFATHYHELQDLENRFPNKIKNYQVLIDENDGEPVFLHKVVRGVADHSFGVAVARIAGVPKDVSTRALVILDELKERAGKNIDIVPVQKELIPFDSHIEFIERINNLDISHTTPLEALNMLAELKRIWDRG